MMWMILQWLHVALTADEARAWPQEYKPESNYSPRSGATKAEKEIAIVNRRGLHARPLHGLSKRQTGFALMFRWKKAAHRSMAKAFWA